MQSNLILKGRSKLILWVFPLYFLQVANEHIKYVLLIGVSLSEPHISESPPQIVVISIMHKELRQKIGKLMHSSRIQWHRLQCILIWFVLSSMPRKVNGVDYFAIIYGLCYRPCHGKNEERLWRRSRNEL